MALGCGCGCGGRKAPGSCGGGTSFDPAVNGFPMAYPVTSQGLIMGSPEYATDAAPAVAVDESSVGLWTPFLGCPVVMWLAGAALALFLQGKGQR